MWGKLLADIIYLSAINMEEQVEQKTSKNSSTSSKLGAAYEGLKAAMAAELMIGFWFGIGIIPAVKMVQNVEYCIEELIS